MDQNNRDDFEESYNWDKIDVPLSEGEYDFEIQSAKYFRSKTNHHGLNLTLTVVGTYGTDDKWLVGSNVFHNVVFSTGAMVFTKRFGVSCGVKLPAKISQTILEAWMPSLIGLKLGARIGTEDWQGTQRPKVMTFFKPGTGGGNGHSSRRLPVSQVPWDDPPEDMGAF